MEFSVVCSGQILLHTFALRKGHGLSHIIQLQVLVTIWPGSGYVSTRNMAPELPIVLEVLTDNLENDFL